MKKGDSVRVLDGDFAGQRGVIFDKLNEQTYAVELPWDGDTKHVPLLRPDQLELLECP